jgi:hypothetical protein
MSRRVTWLALLAGTGLVLGSCSSGPVAGDLTVSLMTPNGDDGAILVSVTASESKELTGATVACGDCQIFREQPSATQIVAVVTGDLLAGPLMRVSVTDTKSPSSYTVRIQQVASRTYQVRSTSGYSLTIGQ